MTTTPVALIQAKLADTALTQQYVSDGCRTAVDKFTAVNTGGGNATLTVHLVPSGGAAGPANAFAKTIPPGGSWPFPDLVGHVLEDGDAISTAATAAGISIRSSGRQLT